VQGIAYVLIIALGLGADTGWARAAVAGVVAILVGGAVLGIDRRTRWPRTRHEVVEFARHDEAGKRLELPSGTILIHLGQEFGHYLRADEVTFGAQKYAMRVFGVDHLRDETAAEVLATV
jgi:hypothetical protein